MQRHRRRLSARWIAARVQKTFRANLAANSHLCRTQVRAWGIGSPLRGQLSGIQRSSPTGLVASIDKQRSRTLDGIAAFVAGEAVLTIGAGEPARVATLEVTDGFLPLVGLSPPVHRGSGAG